MLSKTTLLSHRAFTLPALVLSLAFLPVTSFAVSDNQSQKISLSKKQNASQNKNQAKQALMAKLSKIKTINAKFSQVIVSEDGEVLQEGKGTLAISKPNLVNWHTTEPDETLIVSDGKNLWFYDPFIDQATVYSFNQSIANTPILLLTSEDPTLWDAYQVSQHQPNSYLIHSLDVDSQVKSLELTFNGDELSKLSILDSTGQLSHITLIDVDFISKPEASLFEFVVLEGITVDDQR